jgi:excisionase family DNA binding protein
MSALPLPHPLLTVSEVADHLRVSEMTVYRMITSRDLGATKIGRCWRVPADDLLAYIEDRSTPARQAS